VRAMRVERLPEPVNWHSTPEMNKVVNRYSKPNLSSPLMSKISRCNDVIIALIGTCGLRGPGVVVVANTARKVAVKPRV
jgi:hypothetical protein